MRRPAPITGWRAAAFLLGLVIGLGVWIALSTPDHGPAYCYDADRTHDAPGCEGR